MPDRTSAGDRVLLTLVGDVMGLLDLEELREGLIDALGRAIPSDWVSLNEIGPEPGDVWSVVRPDVPPRVHEGWARLAHQNPLVARAQRTRDSRAYRLSDIIGEAELHNLEIFREVYGPLGLTHQMAFALPSEEGRVLGIALSRSGRDFSDSERDLAERARPFLIQAYRNAIAFSRREPGPTGANAGDLEAGLRWEGLTPREAEIVALVARGASSGDIATRLGISVRTVQKHLQRAYGRLGVRSRSEAAARAWAASGRPPASG